jgi:hypothetical protein
LLVTISQDSSGGIQSLRIKRLPTSVQFMTIKTNVNWPGSTWFHAVVHMTMMQLDGSHRWCDRHGDVMRGLCESAGEWVLWVSEM